MLARIAQELFWLGRDMARAEHTARMLDGAFHADVAGDINERGFALSWMGVLAVIGGKPPAPGEEETDAVAGAPVGPLGRSEIAPLLTLDTDSPASVVSCVARARERGRTLRDVISTEMWEALNSFYLSLGRYDLQAALATGPYSVYQEVKERCALFWGLVERTMLRDEARSLLEAGGRIEEADMVMRMLRVSVPDARADQPGFETDLATGETTEFAAVSLDPTPDSAANAGLETAGHEAEALGLLQAVGGFQAFRRSVRQVPDLRRVMRFLLFDAAYPGSVAASLESLRDSLETADASPRASPPVLRLGRLIADLELQRRTPETLDALHQLLEQVQDELELVDHDIDDRYFAIAALAAVHL